MTDRPADAADRAGARGARASTRALRERRRLRRGLLRGARRLRAGDRRVAGRAGPARRRARRRACAWSAARPPTSPTSTGSPRPTSSGPPTPPRRRSSASAPSRRPLAAAEPPAPGDRDRPRRGAGRAQGGAAARLRRARARARATRSPRCSASYAEDRRRVTVANSDGRFAADDRTRVRLGVQVVARRDGTVETGFETLGGHRGFELVDGGAARARSPSRRREVALTLLDADPAPAGAMPVVVGGGFGGVLFHEMTGHGLEADHIQKGASRLRGQARRAGRPAAPGRLRRRPPARRVGHRRDRRRGHARRRRPR